MNKIYPKDKLSKRELGELLNLIGEALIEETNVSIKKIDKFLDNLKIKTGAKSIYTKQPTINMIEKTLNYLEHFSTIEKMREFLQVAYKKDVPYRLSKEALIYLGSGIIFTSNLDPDEAIHRWEERKNKLNSLNIYQISEEDLIDKLYNDELFPDGYSISSFVKKFHIKIPKKKDKEELVAILVNQLFERPIDRKKIGRWGLDKRIRD